MTGKLAKRFTGFVYLSYFYGWDNLCCPVNLQ